MKKVLIVGSGGREHAIAKKIYNEGHEILMLGENPGVAKFGCCVNLQKDQIAEFCKENMIDLVFIGPEVFLVDGLVDILEKENIRVFGPRRSAAILEGSKAFSKEIMKKYNIPTAKYETFTDFDLAKEYLMTQTFPIVLKADGLASGKGVIIANDLENALSSLKEMMLEQRFSDSGKTVVIEEFLEGEEFSLLSFVSGDIVVPMKIAQDHKRAFDNDEGLNTGGMGAYLPISNISKEDEIEALEKIVIPTAKAMIAEGREFKGVLFAGLMKTKDGIKTIEYNVRFGDPEAEIILESMESSLFEIANNIIEKKDFDIKWNDKSHIGVVLASKGYPEDFEKGYLIEGIENINSSVYHMGTKEVDGKLYTNGGRVLIVVSTANTLDEAKKAVYEDIKKIKCDNLFFRKDIGFRSSN